MWLSFEAASRIFDLANAAFIGSLVIGVISTVTLVWMGNVKETYLRKEVADAGERAAVANAEAGRANKAAAEAQLALEMYRSPRSLSPQQEESLSAMAAQHPGIALDVFLAGNSPDVPQIAEKISRIVSVAGHWRPMTWVWSGVGPITGLLVFVKPGATSENAAAATALVRSIDGSHSTAVPSVWPGEWGQFGGFLNGPTFSADRSEIRLVIGTKPP